MIQTRLHIRCCGGCLKRSRDSTGAFSRAAFWRGLRSLPTNGIAYRIAAFVQPLGLYIQAQCGTLRSLTLRPSALLGSGPGPGAAATFEVTFDGGAPCAALRLVLGKTAKAMPGGDFSVVGARLVRGAYELKPAAGGGPTVAKVAYTV